MPVRRIPYIVLAVALLSVLICAVRDEMDTEEIRKNRYWYLKSRSTETYPVIFGGDSRVFRDISPDHFSAEFGGIESFNYAYWSNGYGRDYLSGLERKIDTGSAIRMIVLGVTPHSLTENAARSEHYSWELANARRNPLHNNFFSRVQEVFAPYRVLELAGQLTGRQQPDNYRITYHQNGWVESYWIVPDTSYSAIFYQDLFEGNPVSEDVIRGLLEFVERWRGMGILVAGFRPPASFAVRQYENKRGGFSEDDFVERFREAGGIWIDVDPDAYRTFDGSHLDHNAAMKLSADLGRQLWEEIKTGSR